MSYHFIGVRELVQKKIHSLYVKIEVSKLQGLKSFTRIESCVQVQQNFKVLQKGIVSTNSVFYIYMPQFWRELSNPALFTHNSLPYSFA